MQMAVICSYRHKSFAKPSPFVAMAPKAKEAARIAGKDKQKISAMAKTMKTGRESYTEAQEGDLVLKWNELVAYTADLVGDAKVKKIAVLGEILPIHPFLSGKLASGEAHAIPGLTEEEVANQPEAARQAKEPLEAQ